MTEERRNLIRMERLVDVRQTFVTAAEAAVHEAENIVRYYRDAAVENTRQIQQAREENAHLRSITADVVLSRERFIHSLQRQAEAIAQDLEKAQRFVEQRQAEWRETMKDKKTVEGVKERRLQEWARSVDVAEQKRVDETTIGKHVRNQFRASADSAAASEVHSPGSEGRRRPNP